MNLGLNGLNNFTIKSLSLDTVLSDTNQRLDYAANPTFTLNEPIYNITSYQVDSFCMTNSIFTIDPRNDTIYWTQYTGTTGTALSAIIPTNFYYGTTIVPALQNALNSYQTNGNYQVALSGPSNAFITITNTTNNFIVETSEFAGNSISYEIGMQNNLTPASSQTGSQTYDLSGLSQINIVTSSLGGNHTQTANSPYKVLTNIPVPGQFGSTITYQGDAQFCSCNMPTLQQFTCTLLDQRYRPLTTNVSEWSLTMYLKLA